MPFGKPFSIVPRAGSDLTGDWVSNFNWVLSSSPLWEPLAPVIDGSILGWEAASVMPEFVIDGLREEDSQACWPASSMAGSTPIVLILRNFSEGPGRMFLTTFRFQGYGQDPFATMLLHQMLKVADVDCIRQGLRGLLLIEGQRSECKRARNRPWPPQTM